MRENLCIYSNVGIASSILQSTVYSLVSRSLNLIPSLASMSLLFMTEAQ